MSLSSQEAAETLSDIERIEKRSREFFGYQKGAPLLFIWGLVWVAGYLASALQPRHAVLIWFVLTVAGLAGSAVARWRTSHSLSWRFPAIALVLFCFISATYLVLPPAHPIQYGAFPPLVVALAYALLGIFGLPRLLWLGVAVFVLTLAGYLWLQPWFGVWMAAVGGGSLLLGGWWLRSA